MATIRARVFNSVWSLFIGLALSGSDFTVAAEPGNEVSANPPAGPVTPSVSPEVTAVMEHLEPLWENMRSEIISSEARFQVYYQVKPQSSLSQSQIHEKLERYQFADDPEQAVLFLRDITGQDVTFVPPVQHMREQGEWLRHDAGPVSYVNVTDFSFIVEPGNKQIHVYDPGRTPTTAESLSIFRTPMKSRAAGHFPTKAERDGQVVHLETVTPPSHRRGTVTSKSTVDWATGVPLSRLHSLDTRLLQETVYSGLTTFSGGVSLPRYSTTIRYEQDRVSSIDLAILKEATFNEPIPEQAFLLSKPANWKVLDYRGDSPGREIPTQAEAEVDVRTLIPETINLLPSVSATQFQQITPMSFPMRAVLVLNGAALIALGIWIWKHASLGRQKH